MEFKVGDKVIVRAPTWCGESIVSRMGFSEKVMYVRRANGYEPAIFKNWATPFIKGQSVFDFYKRLITR